MLFKNMSYVIYLKVFLWYSIRIAALPLKLTSCTIIVAKQELINISAIRQQTHSIKNKNGPLKRH